MTGYPEPEGQEVVVPLEVMLGILTSLDECVGLVGQLQKALASRDVIGQAKGVLMAHEGVDADEAFDILRRASQRLNTKLRDVAAQVVRAVQEQGKSRASPEEGRA